MARFAIASNPNSGDCHRQRRADWPPVACTEVRMVPAMQTPGFPATWPTDGRVGGVPDPATAGPDIVQIGSEGGLLPVPAILKSQPVTYETNVRSITMFNILNHDLLMGGGERADVLIDFSKYAGKTLIVYNDAPTPMPAVDPRTDYLHRMATIAPMPVAPTTPCPAMVRIPVP